MTMERLDAILPRVIDHLIALDEHRRTTTDHNEQDPHQ